MSKCDNCNQQLELEKQRVGQQITSDEKPDGAIYSNQCDNCGHKNPEKIRKMIQGENQ